MQSLGLMPSPLDVKAIKGFTTKTRKRKSVTRKADDDEKFSAVLAFKVDDRPVLWVSLTFVRVYSGVLKKGGHRVTTRCDGKKERMAVSFKCTPTTVKKSTKSVRATYRCLRGLERPVTTGETLCDPNAVITLERMVFPDSVIRQAIEPKTKADQEKMGIACRAGCRRSIFPRADRRKSGQTIIGGQGELHLEIIVDRMKREFGVEANVGKASSGLPRNHPQDR